MTGIQRRLAIGGIAALTALAVLATATSGTQPKQPDLQLALYTNGACGAFADSLPAIVTQTGMAPGATVKDLTVCVRNVGDAGQSLILSAAELVDLDPACTGDEARVDATCGGGRLGELSASLRQRVGVDACRRDPPIALTLDRSLASLATSPLLLADQLKKDKPLCVRLLLRYEPSAAAAVASQSDRTSWRYSFSLSSG